jgi:hypothetical protein
MLRYFSLCGGRVKQLPFGEISNIFEHFGEKGSLIKCDGSKAQF